MKTFFMLTTFHTKRILRDKYLLLGLVLLPIFILILVSAIKFGDKSSNNSISIVSDSPYFNEKILNKLPDYYKSSIKENLASEEEKVLSKNTSLLAYIPSDFKDSKNIEYISLYGENRDTILEATINGILVEENLINKDEIKNEIKDTDINIKSNLVTLSNKKEHYENNGSGLLFMLIYYIMFSIIFLGSDYLTIFGDNIKKRSSTTNSKDSITKGALLFTYFLLLTLIYTLLSLSICIYFNNPWTLAILFILIVISFVIYSLGLMLSLLKITKNKSIYLIYTLPVIVGIFFLPNIAEKVKYFEPLKYLSPTYFAEELLYSGYRMENLLIIILMGIVLFLASILNYNVE